MAPKFRFQEGEKVLCFHGPLLYEAKCVKFQMKEKQIKYFVHYQGWNKSWDEWVPEGRVLKFNEANLQKQKELREAQDAQKRGNRKKKLEEMKEKEKDVPSPGAPPVKEEGEKKKAKSGPGSVTSVQQDTKEVKEVVTGKEVDGQRKNKRSRIDAHVEPEEAFITKSEIKIKIPEELKPWLVDDWDLVTRQKKLVNLPARITVDKILQDYFKQRTGKGTSQSKESTVLEMVNGIKEYFNSMLGSQLLYKFERPQYQSVKSENPEDTPMSSIYGSIHLLRLFVKIGGMLVYTTLDEKSTQLVLGHTHDLLKYMARNSSLFSLSDYVVASPEYQRKAV